jgi:hypothetical protein
MLPSNSWLLHRTEGSYKFHLQLKLISYAQMMMSCRPPIQGHVNKRGVWYADTSQRERSEVARYITLEHGVIKTSESRSKSIRI